MPRSSSRLDTINEANHETPYEFGSLDFNSSGNGQPKQPSPIPTIGRVNAQATGNRGAGGILGGLGGSIISSSGMNQGFKDYANNESSGLTRNQAGIGGTSSSSIPIIKPINVSPHANNSPSIQTSGQHNFSGFGSNMMFMKQNDSPSHVYQQKQVSGIGSGGADINTDMGGLGLNLGSTGALGSGAVGNILRRERDNS